MNYCVNFESIPWECPLSGMRQKAYRAEGRCLRLVEYFKSLPAHWCEKGHVGYVLEGQMEVRFENQVQRFAPGDGLFIPDGPEHKHTATMLTDTVTVILLDG
jgi:hypothetical protein